MKPIKKGKSFYFVRHENGKQRWVSLKTKHREEAVIRMAEILRQRHREHFGIAKDPQDIPWHALIAKVLDLKRGNGDSPRTLARAKVYFSNVERYMDIRMTSEWSSEILEEFKRVRLDSGASPGTVNKELEAVRTALRKARKWGYIAPALEELLEVRKVKDPRKPSFCFSDLEAERLLESAKPFWRIAILLGLRAGLRRSEALHLLWDDVDFERLEIRIVDRPGAHTKNRKSRVIPMDEELLQPLVEWKAHCGGAPRVLPWKNETYEGKGYFTQGFMRLLKRMGFPKPAKYHSLRHTFATNLARVGVSQLKIAYLLGHSARSSSVTGGYTHLEFGDLRDALRMLRPMGKPSNVSSNDLGDIGPFRPTNSNMRQLGEEGKS